MLRIEKYDEFEYREMIRNEYKRDFLESIWGRFTRKSEKNFNIGSIKLDGTERLWLITWTRNSWDRIDRIHTWVDSKEEAIRTVNDLNSKVPKYSKKIEDLTCRVLDMCRYHLEPKYGEEYALEWGSNQLLKIKEKYPHLTCNKSESEVVYRYVSVGKYQT